MYSISNPTGPIMRAKTEARANEIAAILTAKHRTGATHTVTKAS